jgi:hypothetical protein
MLEKRGAGEKGAGEEGAEEETWHRKHMNF